ncbi:hypothetical protein, partial [Novosphingobium guangzhouense]|uniref:hypothetical protein n=1 Tax=Novosphingobium guangzhouense TaxID=1850347 RepID=UPI001B8093C7
TEVYFNLLADGRLRHRNANATMAGIDTDAYILAVSHPMRSDGNTAPDEITVVDASYVRRSGVALVDSLAKVTAHLTMGASTQVQFSGAHGNVRIACSAPVQVVGEAGSVACSNGQAVLPRTH